MHKSLAPTVPKVSLPAYPGVTAKKCLVKQKLNVVMVVVENGM